MVRRDTSDFGLQEKPGNLAPKIPTNLGKGHLDTGVYWY